MYPLNVTNLNHIVRNAGHADLHTRETDVRRVRDLDWNECRNILEGSGFQVYDNETVHDLRVAIRVNIEDGTFERTILMEV